MFRAALTSIVIAVAAIAAVPVAGAIFIVAAAPTATADTCGPGYYWSPTHQTCVESPDSSTSNVTAICRDGSDSHSLTHSGTCSGHGGVAQWCPCGSAPQAVTNGDEQVATSGGDQQYVADLLSLGVQLTADKRIEYRNYAESVCRGMDSGYSPVDNMTYNSRPSRIERPS
jgi:hypothetical protein